MSLIKIIANNIELDFVKETLSIKKENNALNRDFKVSYSSIPFLIIENANTKKALGTRDLSSVKKIKTIDVIVFEAGIKYTGELQILNYINGFRKCNLRFASEILTIINKKISEFMPIVSVIPGTTTIVPFSENSEIALDGSENWQTYPLPFLDKNYPAVKWQFPTMSWVNKFGVDLEYTDKWFNYKNKINNYDADGLILNTAVLVSDNYIVTNNNVAAPQVFLLSPLFYALQSIGFSFDGSFSTDTFIQKLLFLSTKNNLTKTKPYINKGAIVLSELLFVSLPGQEEHYSSRLTIPADRAGSYYIYYSFEETTAISPTSFTTRKLFFGATGQDSVLVYSYLVTSPNNTYSGKIKLDISDEFISSGGVFFIDYETDKNTYPTYSLSYTIAHDKEYFQMHPTIQLGRYLPDWTFGTYLNALQNFFNLEINLNDAANKITINFNEKQIVKAEKVVINKSLAVTSYEQIPYDAFLLKYDNDDDEALWITSSGSQTYTLQTSAFLEKLDSKFKKVPFTTTAYLSDELENKNGVGLMIYNPEKYPNTSENYLGQHLNIEGSKGIYDSYWKIWLKFRLNGSAVEMLGPFTEQELAKIINLKRIFIDNQEYIIANTESRETDQNNYEVTFNLVSITF